MADAPTLPKRPGFWRALFSEKDNQTADLKRVLWALGFGWALAMETWAVVWRGQAFDLVSAGLGVSGLLAAGGASLALNRKNENGAPDA